MRLGIYMDFVYTADAEGVSAEHAVVVFALGLAPRIGEVTLLGRLAPEPARAPYSVDVPCVRFTALPHYRSLTELASVGRTIRRSCAVFHRALHELDAVWLFTPSPLSLMFAAIARRRGKPVIFGVRQDTAQYFAHRLPSRRWLWAVPLAHGADQLQRLLARRVPTTVVGHALAHKFGAGRNPVHEMAVSLVRRSDIVTFESALAKPWDGNLRLLSVGRLDLEKNPLMLADVVADLRSRDARWTMDVAGDGPLTEPLRKRVAELGVGDAVRIHGYVPNGEPLQALYRRANALIHVSLTEGLPQVISEAQAAGLPIAGTDVGGVSAALLDGRAGLLVPARDVRGMAQSLERLRDDAALRARLIEAGLRSVQSHTMDAQLDGVETFIRQQVAQSRCGVRLRRHSPPRGSHVLMYHDVIDGQAAGDSGWPGSLAERYKIKLRRFERQLDRIAAAGVAVGLLDESGGGPCVALTFDDGGISALVIADALERRGWRGHFFVTTGRIGTAGFLDVAGVRALTARGHVVGSHSHTHPSYMARLPAAHILEEWQRSRDVLHEMLGRPPVLASLPGGMYSEAVARIAGTAGYRLLLTSEPRAPISRFGDLTVLGRYPIRSRTVIRRVVGYATGSRAAQGSARVEWRVKGTARRLAPRLYRFVTRAPDSDSANAPLPESGNRTGCA